MSMHTTADVQPRLETPVEAVETPVLLVDVETMKRNVREYAAFADEQGVRLRSHVKTHKNADIANFQDEVTGGGVCCQTLGEAEVMASNGLDDVYLSYQVVGERKLDRLLRLNEKLSRFATTVDSRATTEPLQRAAAERGTTVETILEVDVGLGRTGAALEEAPALATYIDDQPNLDFAGLLAYEGHVKGLADSAADFERLCAETMDGVAEAVSEIEARDVPVREVKVGGTATSWYSGKHPVVTEINPGMYPFNDVSEIEARPSVVGLEDCAATVSTTVISVPDGDRAVVDAGSKTFSMDKAAMPRPKHRDDVRYVNYSEEHGWLDVSDADVSVGDRIEFVVPHVCTTVNLHDRFVGHRDGRVVDIWDVQARGKVR